MPRFAPYTPPLLPLVADRDALSIQLSRHMNIMCGFEFLSDIERKSAHQTLSRCQNFLVEWKPDQSPNFKGWSIGPFRFSVYIVGSIIEYMRTKKTLETGPGSDALKHIASDAKAAEDGDPIYKVIESYLAEHGINRQCGYIVTYVDGPPVEEKELLKVESLFAEAEKLSVAGRVMCARRMASLINQTSPHTSEY